MNSIWERIPFPQNDFAMKRHFEWVRDRKKVFGKARKWRKSWVKLTTWAEKIIVKKSFDKQLRGIVKNKQIFYGQVDRKGCTSQKYSTKFESKNSHILPTGQWYAPSAVIKDAMIMQ